MKLYDEIFFAEELDADALRTYEKEQINQEKLSAEHKRKVQEKVSG